MPVIVETPDVAVFTREDFERAWLLGADDPRCAPVVPETAIVVSRTSALDFQDRQVYVWIDDVSLGNLRYGQCFSHAIEPGEHTVRVFNTLMSRSLTVHVAPGEQVRLQCGNGMPTAGWLMMIFLHVTYLRVWIEREKGS